MAEDKDSAKADDAKSMDSKPKDTKPKDTKPKDTKPKDTKPKDTKPKDTKPKAAGAKAGKGEGAKADGGGSNGSGAKAANANAAYEARFKQIYNETVRAKLIETFKYKNPMQVPRLEKVVINMGIGEAVADKKKLDSAAGDLALIAGQKPVITKARKSIATYKLREDMPLGAKVTLRGRRMFEFLDRLVTIALPRVKDFRGLNPKSFDGRGNFAMGLKEHIVFPEIDYDKVDEIWGMDIIVCTSAPSDDEARELLRAINFPFPPKDGAGK